MTSRMLSTAAVALGCGLSLASVSNVLAQEQRVMVTRTMMDSGGGTGAISRRTLERWCEQLGFDAEQKAAALALHEAHMSEYQAAQKELADVALEASRDRETADPGDIARRMMEARNRMNERTRALEKSFMDDLRSLLAAEQEERWPGVERMRRREINTRNSTVSGDTVDLRQVLEGLKLERPDWEALGEAIEEYEIELDRAIQSRLRVAEQGDGIDFSRGVDVETLQKRMAEAREAGLKLKEINQRHARKLEGLVPEAKRPEYAAAVKRQTFPRVYRESTAGKHIAAAGRLEDLDAQQREAIAELKSQYDRELAAANEAWAAAIEKNEANPSQGGSFGGGGGNVAIRFGDEDPELAEARKNRREVDERARKKLGSILRPEQQEKLPRPEMERDMVVPVGGAVIVR